MIFLRRALVTGPLFTLAIFELSLLKSIPQSTGADLRVGYKYGTSLLIFFSSAACTKVAWRRFRFVFWDLVVNICLR